MEFDITNKERALTIEPVYKKQFVQTIKYTRALSQSALKRKKKRRTMLITHPLQVFLRETIGQVNHFAKTKLINLYADIESIIISGNMSAMTPGASM